MLKFEQFVVNFQWNPFFLHPRHNTDVKVHQTRFASTVIGQNRFLLARPHERKASGL